MSHLAFLTETKASIHPGVVRSLESGGPIVVSCRGEQFLCDQLQTAASAPLGLAPGDRVLVWLPGDEASRGVVLGRVAPPKADDGPMVAEDDVPVPAPDEVVVEARQNLTFRCGEGSITIRSDGKILIKGKDLVSHARRMNRIKGGAVAIN